MVRGQRLASRPGLDTAVEQKGEDQSASGKVRVGGTAVYTRQSPGRGAGKSR